MQRIQGGCGSSTIAASHRIYFPASDAPTQHQSVLHRSTIRPVEIIIHLWFVIPWSPSPAVTLPAELTGSAAPSHWKGDSGSEGERERQGEVGYEVRVRPTPLTLLLLLLTSASVDAALSGHRLHAAIPCTLLCGVHACRDHAQSAAVETTDFVLGCLRLSSLAEVRLDVHSMDVDVVEGVASGCVGSGSQAHAWVSLMRVRQSGSTRSGHQPE